MKRQIQKSFLLLLAAVIWGVAFVAQSVGMEYVKPFTFNGVRCLIGGLVLIPCIFLLERLAEGNVRVQQDENLRQKKHERNRTGVQKQICRIKEGRESLIIGGICCGICLCVASNLQQIAIQYVTVGKAGFLTAFYIVMVPILGIVLRKKCGPFIWCSVVLAMLGLYMLCMKGSFSLEMADLLLLMSAFVFAVHILVIDYFAPLVSGVKLSCIQFFICGTISIVIALLVENPVWSQIIAAWKPILYAGVLSCGVAYTLQIIGQKDMNPTVASLILSLESVVSVLAGWLFLKQTLTIREFVGCVITFGAIILAQIPVKET